MFQSIPRCLLIAFSMHSMFPSICLSQEASNKLRLSFPKESVGKLLVRPLREQRYVESMDFDSWRPIADAQGTVTAPRNWEIRLDVNKRASADLSWLDDLPSKSLTALRLRNTDATDEDLKHVGRLTSLEWLDLDDLNITDAGIRQLEELIHLKSIKVEGFRNGECRGIGDEGVRMLSQLPELVRLDVSRSSVTGKAMPHIGKMRKLISLDLSGSEIGDNALKHLAALPNLRSLSLGVYEYGVGLTDEGLKHIAKIPELEWLRLSASDISDDGLQTIAHMPNLESLDLDYTKITPAGLKHLKTLPKLKKLRIQSMHVDDQAAFHLGQIKSLEDITGQLEITDVGLEHLLTLSNLKKLKLDGPSISDESVSKITELKSLTYLSISDCKVTDESLTAVGSLKDLEILSIRDTKISDRIIEVAADLPKLWLLRLSFDKQVIQDRGEDFDLAKLNAIPNLKRLELEGEGIPHKEFEDLAQLTSLESLEIVNTGSMITDKDAAHLSKMSNLRDLNFRRTQLSAKGIKQLAHLRRLERFAFESRLNDDDLIHFKEFASLRFLQIGSPLLTAEGISQIVAEMPTLEQVNHFGR